MVKSLNVSDRACFSGGVLVSNCAMAFERESLICPAHITSGPTEWPGNYPSGLRGGEIYYDPTSGANGRIEVYNKSGWVPLFLSDEVVRKAPTTTAQNTVTASGATNVPLTLKGANSVGVYILDCQNYSGTTLLGMQTNGILYLSDTMEWLEKSADPTTPAASRWGLYFKSDGLYYREDSGAIRGPLIGVAGEPTGFPNRTDSVLSFVSGTRTFTIAPTGVSFKFYQDAIEYTKTSQNVIISDVTGLHAIYFDAGTLTELANPSHSQYDNLMENYPIVALVYWNATDGAAYILADERHGIHMDGATHHWIHDNVGAVYKDGFGLSGYTPLTGSDAALTFEVTNGEFYDEDLEFEIDDGSAANQYEQQLNGGDAEIPVLYRDDVDGSWTEAAASTLPYLTAGSGRLAYNNDDGDGTFSQVEVGNGRYMTYTLIASNDWQYPVKMIQGQNDYITKTAALEDGASEILNFGALPDPEFVVLYRFIMQTSNGFGGAKKAEIVEVVDFRASRISGASVVSSDHGSLGGLGDDDHNLYSLANGTRWTTTQTASRAVVSDASGYLIVAPATTATEIGYVNGVTSAIQTQLNARVVGPSLVTDNTVARFNGTTGKLVQDSVVTISDTNGDIGGVRDLVVTGDITTAETASRALQTDASSKIEASSVTSTELAALSGVTATPTVGKIPIASTNGLTGWVNYLPVELCFYGGVITLTNCPAGRQEWFAVFRKRWNLTKVEAIRMVCGVSVAATGGATPVAYFEYDNGGGWTQLNSNTVDLTSVTYPYSTTWENIPAGAQTNVSIRLVTIDGDGADDPQITMPGLQIAAIPV